jgi:hypothetical protein
MSESQDAMVIDSVQQSAVASKVQIGKEKKEKGDALYKEGKTKEGASAYRRPSQSFQILSIRNLISPFSTATLSRGELLRRENLINHKYGRIVTYAHPH